MVVVAVCLFEGNFEQLVVLKGKAGGGKNITRAVEELAAFAQATQQPISESLRIAFSYFVQQMPIAIAFAVDLHFRNKLSNVGIAFISAWRVDERTQALNVRYSGSSASFARSLEFLLDSVDCNVVEVAFSGEDVVGRVARVF
ncbi:hypothetical protein A3731_35545 [Roseovarius sp. HI0049]|nr:hypothetical protein A3731_35545 [Roseovarius sp. HI0049]